MRTALLLCVVCVAAACEQSIQPTASAYSQPATTAAPRKLAWPREPTRLEFEVPEEFTARTDAGGEVVSGFRVGYFRPGALTPFATFEVPRSGVVVSGRTGVLTLTPQPLPDDVNTIHIRVQTVGRQQSSAWSEPSAVTDVRPPLPPSKRVSTAKPTVSQADVDRHAELAKALTAVLPPDTAPEIVLSAYQRLDELATAVVISRDHGVPITKLSEVMKGPPRQSLRVALLKVQPELKPGPVLAKARTDSRALLRPQERKKPK